MYAWSSWHTAAPLGIGIAGLLFWVVYSIYFTRQPMIPLKIMRNRTAAISYLGNLIQGVAQFAMLFYLPLYYQAVLGYSATISGVALVSLPSTLPHTTKTDNLYLQLPQCLVAGLFSAIIGILIAKHNTIKPFVLTGWTIYTLGLGLLVALKPTSTIPDWIFINIPSGIGLGCLFSSLALATQSAAEVSGTHSPAEVAKIKGMAAGLNPFSRTLGQALGIVIAQAAFTNDLRKRLGAKLALDAASFAQVISTLPSASAERKSLVGAYNDSLHVIWWTMFALAASMLLLTLATKDIGLFQKQAGGNVDVGSSTSVSEESRASVEMVGKTSMTEPGERGARTSFVDVMRRLSLDPTVEQEGKGGVGAEVTAV